MILRTAIKVSPLSYCLALPEGTRIHNVVSIILLRPYKGSGEGIRPLPVTVDDEDEFEVERIDGERINSQGDPEYLVNGYADKERTWEPRCNLTHVDRMIAEWHSRTEDTPAKGELQIFFLGGTGLVRRIMDPCLCGWGLLYYCCLTGFSCFAHRWLCLCHFRLETCFLRTYDV